MVPWRRAWAWKNGDAGEISPLLPNGSSPLFADAENAQTTSTRQTVDPPSAFEEPTNASDLERQPPLDARLNTSSERLQEVSKRVKSLFPILAVGTFLSGADQTFTFACASKIGSDLDALNMTSWVATAYILALASFQPIYGKISDIFGRKSCLLFGYMVFSLGSLGCGVARDINELIIARALQGTGGAAMSPVLSILLSDTISLKERGTWTGLSYLIFASGAAAGAPLGGLLADNVGWRWLFLIQAPICLTAFTIIALALEVPQLNKGDWKENLRRVDFYGAALLLTAISSLLLGMDRGSNVTWTDSWTLVPLCISVSLFVLFACVEGKVAAEPIAPGHVIFERSLLAAYCCNFFSFMSYFAVLFYIPRFFEVEEAASATKSGLLMLPAVFASATGSLSSGFYMKRTGKYYRLTVLAYMSLVVGMLIITLSSGLLVTSTVGICIGLAISGFSNGAGTNATLISRISIASHEDQAVATACSYIFRSLGSTIGISLASAVANQVLRGRLAAALNNVGQAEKIVDQARQSLDFIDKLEPNIQDIVRHCYAVSTRAAFILGTCLALGAAIPAWLIREKPLSDELPSRQGGREHNASRT